MNQRVAIFQNTLTAGGRIKVVIEMIRILNELKIVPDVYTFRVNNSLKIEKGLKFRIKRLFSPIYGLYELKVLALNLMMNFFAKNYDLLINSNNALLFTPSKTSSISYIHFPREARISSKYLDLAFPDGKLVSESNLGIRAYRAMLNLLRKIPQKKIDSIIITNSVFSKRMLLEVYPEFTPDKMSVIYPPIAITAPESNKKNDNVVITLGRFSADKRQLEQIQIAEKFPDLRFEIIGFVGDRKSEVYFNKCRNYQEKKVITNVEFHPNLPPQKVKEKLQTSRFFMHNLRNEPFGISTVEAIAAGCIPIVHDSGGQREIVPFAELRYENKEHAVELLKNIENLDHEAISLKLRQNISQFDHSVFRVMFKKILTEALVS